MIVENVQFRKLMKDFREEGLLEVSNAKGATTVFVEFAVFALLCWGLASVVWAQDVVPGINDKLGGRACCKCSLPSSLYPLEKHPHAASPVGWGN